MRCSEFLAACDAGDIESVADALDRMTPDVFATESYVGIYRSASGGHAKAMRLILARAAELGIPEPSHLCDKYALMVAIAHGHVAAAEVALEVLHAAGEFVDIQQCTRKGFAVAGARGFVGVMEFTLAYATKTGYSIDIHIMEDWAFCGGFSMIPQVGALEILLRECTTANFEKSPRILPAILRMPRASPVIVEFLVLKFGVDIPPGTLERWNIPVADLSIPCLLSAADKQTPFGVACAAQLDLIFESHSQWLGTAADVAIDLYAASAPHMSCLRHSAFPLNIADTVLAHLAPPGWDNLVRRRKTRV